MSCVEVGSSVFGDVCMFGTPELRGHVLLVDDAPDVLRVTSRLLGYAGLQVTTASNGRDAVEKALAAEEAGAGFDLILMDVQLPIIDGIEATALLRISGFKKPIIALSGLAMPGVERECLRAGCNEFVAKAVEFDHIYEALRRYLKPVAG